jgi:hypothetical protein
MVSRAFFDSAFCCAFARRGPAYVSWRTVLELCLRDCRYGQLIQVNLSGLDFFVLWPVHAASFQVSSSAR